MIKFFQTHYYISTWKKEDIGIINLNLNNKLKIIQSQKPDKPGDLI